MPKMAAIGMSAKSEPLRMFDVTMIRCFLWRSTQTPTNNPKRSQGTDPMKIRIPCSVGFECSMMTAVNGRASVVNWLPNCEMVSEVQSFRKL